MLYNFSPIPIFDAWLGFSGSIPDIFWNVYSEEQRYKFLCKRICMLVEYANELGYRINANADAIEELAQQLAEIESPEYWEEKIKPIITAWIDDHLEFIFENVLLPIHFGLTDDGYFCAYYPSSWKQVQFDTGANYGQFDYGRLILRYNVDGSGVIDNTGRYDEADIQPQIDELKTRVTNTEKTLYTPMREGGDV